MQGTLCHRQPLRGCVGTPVGRNVIKNSMYTEDEILEILIEDHNLRSKHDLEVDPSLKIEPNLLIRDWIEGCDLLSIIKLRIIFNEWFNTNISHDDWCRNLMPIKEKKLRDLCRLLSLNSKKITLNQVKLFGRICKKASLYRYFSQENKFITPSSLFSNPIMDDNWSLFQKCQLLRPGFHLEFKYKINKKFDFLVWKVPVILGVLSLIVYYWSGIGSICLMGVLFIYTRLVYHSPNLFNLNRNKYDYFLINDCENLKEFIRQEEAKLLE